MVFSLPALFSFSPDAFLNTSLQERYYIHEHVGSGATAWVFRVFDLQEERPLAFKLLLPSGEQDPDIRTRFFEEARLLRQLEHPNIVRLAGFINKNQTCGMLLEWINGEDLSKLLKRLDGKPSDVWDVWQLISPILDALTYAHDKGLIHRDIKPENILLHHEGDTIIPKLTDFGIAKSLFSTDQGLTKTGSAMGTFHYTAPEQLMDSKSVDARADIYSIGVILYVLATGKFPFIGEHAGALIFAQLHNEPVAPRKFAPDIPVSFEALILRCLAKKPEERFPSCKALRHAFSMVLFELQNEQMHDETIAMEPDTVLQTPMQLAKNVSHTLNKSLEWSDRPSMLFSAAQELSLPEMDSTYLPPSSLPDTLPSAEPLLERFVRAGEDESFPWEDEVSGDDPVLSSHMSLTALPSRQAEPMDLADWEVDDFPEEKLVDTMQPQLLGGHNATLPATGSRDDLSFSLGSSKPELFAPEAFEETLLPSSPSHEMLAAHSHDETLMAAGHDATMAASSSLHAEMERLKAERERQLAMQAQRDEAFEETLLPPSASSPSHEMLAAHSHDETLMAAGHDATMLDPSSMVAPPHDGTHSHDETLMAVGHDETMAASSSLHAEMARLKAERERQIQIAQREREIAQRERQLAERERQMAMRAAKSEPERPQDPIPDFQSSGIETPQILPAVEEGFFRRLWRKL